MMHYRACTPFPNERRITGPHLPLLVAFRGRSLVNEPKLEGG